MIVFWSFDIKGQKGINFNLFAVFDYVNLIFFDLVGYI